MTFCMYVVLYDGNQHRTVETAIKTFYVEFCRTTPYVSKLHCDVVPVSVVLGVVSQLPKLWRNDSRSTGKQKTFKRDFRVFLYTPKMRFTQFGG